MQFRILGPLEVDEGDGPIPLGGPKQRAVLAHLLLRADQVVPTGTLVGQVWGDRQPPHARNTLQTYVSNLRRIVGGERLRSRSPGYVLRVDPLEVDAARFDACVSDARRVASERPEIAVAALDEGLSLWRGPALADLADQPSLQAEAARLDELRIGAQADRVEALLAQGEDAKAICEVELLVADNPLHERLWGLLMLALYRNGRQAEALLAFQRVGDLLRDELGINPTRELTGLHRRLLAQDPDLGLRDRRGSRGRILEELTSRSRSSFGSGSAARWVAGC